MKNIVYVIDFDVSGMTFKEVNISFYC